MSENRDTISAEAHLFIEVGGRVYRYRLSAAVTSVGSEGDNVVRIREDSVSPHHLLITYVDGDFFLRRVGDSPVQLNGETVENYSEELRYGDFVGIGDVRIRLVEGGDTSDVAVLLLVYARNGGAVPPWQVFLSRRTELSFGETPADLLLSGAGRTVVENYGHGAQYVVPPGKGVDTLQINDTPVPRRVALKDGDELVLPGHTVKVRFLRGEIMEEAETLLWPETLRRFSMPDES
ncbi:MAG: FHA domain-containing protein [Deltaproteobacteria bacterium]|nr:FHA domain-containing protein [Deltaproteobacteria bacterium]